ncbi:hypothetical protein [Cystobacter fuscus]|uniref:hypothetical protein n=1 Tax=Cystobacter fuscus TaxID=43 RepID=UPI002B2E0B83|nr:hypothetical protein F0U63_03065 [Cystobacter fuscus]
MLLVLTWMLAASPTSPSPAPERATAGTSSAPSGTPANGLPSAPSSTPVPLRWDVPGLLAWVDTDGPIAANGIPVLIQLARSSRSVDDLASHFVRFFEKEGLFVAPLEKQAAITREPQLTALDPKQMLSYTVILQANPDKTTSVILGTANVGAWKPQKQSQSLGWAPLMPGARNLLRTEAEGQSSAAYDVDSTPDKVQTFYREELEKAGYKATGQPGEYRRGSEWLRVRARPDAKGLMVWLVRQLGGVDPAAPAP